VCGFNIAAAASVGHMSFSCVGDFSPIAKPVWWGCGSIVSGGYGWISARPKFFSIR
jgi:hypothetical protein